MSRAKQPQTLKFTAAKKAEDYENIDEEKMPKSIASMLKKNKNTNKSSFQDIIENDNIEEFIYRHRKKLLENINPEYISLTIAENGSQEMFETAIDLGYPVTPIVFLELLETGKLNKAKYANQNTNVKISKKDISNAVNVIVENNDKKMLKFIINHFEINNKYLSNEAITMINKK
jgi:hypothetical protein